VSSFLDADADDANPRTSSPLLIRTQTVHYIPR